LLNLLPTDGPRRVFGRSDNLDVLETDRVIVVILDGLCRVVILVNELIVESSQSDRHVSILSHDKEVGLEPV